MNYAIRRPANAIECLTLTNCSYYRHRSNPKLDAGAQRKINLKGGIHQATPASRVSVALSAERRDKSILFQSFGLELLRSARFGAREHYLQTNVTHFGRMFAGSFDNYGYSQFMLFLFCDETTCCAREAEQQVNPLKSSTRTLSANGPNEAERSARAPQGPLHSLF